MSKNNITGAAFIIVSVVGLFLVVMASKDVEKLKIELITLQEQKQELQTKNDELKKENEKLQNEIIVVEELESGTIEVRIEMLN